GVLASSNCQCRMEISRGGGGVGGHCIAVDPWFIVSMNPGQAKIIRTARLVNDFKPDWVAEQIRLSSEQAGKQRGECDVALYGITFKPNIDDLRQSPALEIAKKVKKMGFRQVLIVEPNVSRLQIGRAHV